MPTLAITRDGRLHLVGPGAGAKCLCGAPKEVQADVFAGTFEDFRRDRVHCRACWQRLRN